MMELEDITRDAITPAMEIIGLPMTPKALTLMLAIGLQESRFTHRRQMGNGPAAGFWQFERGGGVKGVLKHPASELKAVKLCGARGVDAAPLAVWEALQVDDVLAAGFARLLLLTDPKPLPDVADELGAWAYYLWCWRPGKPHPETWPELHRRAREFVE